MNEYIFEVASQFHRLGKYYGNTSDTHFTDIYEETIKLINKKINNMNPKEKAKELFNKMVSKNPNIQDGISIIDKLQAKQCALVAVDLIYESNLKLHFGFYLDEFEDKENYYSYWEEVKKEIENL